MQQIHHKKNELFKVEFYQDKECTEAFDFTNARNLYIEGDLATLMDLFATQQVDTEADIYIPYLTTTWNELCLQDLFSSPVKTLNDITPNLSKYIPEDNAVLFLSEKDRELYDCYPVGTSRVYNEKFELPIESSGCGDPDCSCEYPYTKITIFLPYGTQSELQKAKEVAKELMEKYGVEEVNLCVLHNFLKELSYNSKITYYEEVASSVLEDAIFCDRVWEAWNYGTMSIDDFARMEDGHCEDMIQERANLLFNIIELNKTPKQIFDECKNRNFTSYKEPTLLQYFNKIITTNSTGILPVRDTERLQVIDCKEIFEEYLKENN